MCCQMALWLNSHLFSSDITLPDLIVVVVVVCLFWFCFWVGFFLFLFLGGGGVVCWLVFFNTHNISHFTQHCCCYKTICLFSVVHVIPWTALQITSLSFYKEEKYIFLCSQTNIMNWTFLMTLIWILSYRQSLVPSKITVFKCVFLSNANTSLKLPCFFSHQLISWTGHFWLQPFDFHINKSSLTPVPQIPTQRTQSARVLHETSDVHYWSLCATLQMILCLGLGQEVWFGSSMMLSGLWLNPWCLGSKFWCHPWQSLDSLCRNTENKERKLHEKNKLECGGLSCPGLQFLYLVKFQLRLCSETLKRG